MTLLLDAVQRLFKYVLAMRNETRVLRSPSWMRHPFIIKYLLAHLISSAADSQAFSFGEQSITGAEPAAITQNNLVAGDFGSVFDDLVTPVVLDEIFEIIHQIDVAANEPVNFVQKSIFVDDVLREKIAELEKFVVCLLVANRFPDPIKEGNLV